MNKHRLYNTFVAPRSSDPNIRNQEVVLNWLLLGSLVLALMAFIIVSFSTALLDSQLWPRLLVIGALFGLFAGLLVLSRRWQQQIVPSVVLIAIFFASAFLIVYHWDIVAPTGTLLFSLVIVIAGILLNARSSLYAALLVALTLSAVEYAKAHHHIHPDLSWEQLPSNFVDVASFTAIYAIMALTSWLFNGRMEVALTRAKRSEKALQRQRDLLEIKVEERTRALQAAQLEQIQEVYRFAELGHLSTALFHDLANHLMSVSIDIEGLQKGKRSDLMVRIQDNIHYIDEVVRRVRRQISGQYETEQFNLDDETQEVIRMLSYQAAQAKVTVSLQASSPHDLLIYRGDLTRFRQIIINLLSNAIEAYDKPDRRSAAVRQVSVVIERLPAGQTISITDYGKVIKPSLQSKIFEPFYTTKDKGMGIGLFIVKKVAEEDFGGTITVTSSKSTGTTFIVTIPKQHGRRPVSSAR